MLCHRIAAWPHACRFAPDTAAATSPTGANGSSIYFLGRYYDNLKVHRSGVTSLNWPKPKLKFKLNKKVAGIRSA